jgi:hypothetical protein
MVGARQVRRCPIGTQLSYAATRLVVQDGLGAIWSWAL